VSSTKTHLTRVGVVIVPVADQEKAIDFYTNILGFEVRNDVPMGPDARWVEVGPPGADTTVAVCPPPPGGATGDKQTGIAFQTPDIDALHADLKAHGVDVDAEVSRFGGDIPPLLWFRDMEGNVLMAAEGR
jgi:catechol 2,3-dioxygenase-like lactoylglutathione lyase family enzyme